MNELKHFSANVIQNLDRQYRANLINAISGYKPANLIGTYSETGLANLAIFSSIVHLGASPPLIGFVQRPISQFSHTYKNIHTNGYYTINHVHEEFIENAHFTSAKFDENASEFEACGLTIERFPDFKAPFVKESKIRIGMRYVQELPININNTILMIGEIEHLFIPKNAILKDGDVNLSKVNDVCTSGLYTYNRVTKVKTFPYAKVKNLSKF